MPVHKVPAASLHEDLIQIQREGEVIDHVIQQSRNYWLVVTRFPSRHAELRPLTHAARVGAMEQRAEWDRDPLLQSFLTDDIVRDGDA